ncbi:CHAT domain-containing protein [Lyngbya sp. CCAP 1446/10]|uniref:CHAT domain-containing tetratricopeptide repeat protein n=1 Tax=Lyngbya sp. CCAP 1446/10 TaxID=439293 RepID=UPI002238AC36|nr:CHAT domain-containing protein [Lyngbya sp. CCAP 1446/10]MCW6051860.1 CHAT domain-containing protein [Lyngbya sp. CCAP 1446/10]
MSKSIILVLASGTLGNGFAHVTAELKESEKTRIKFSGSLPPAPEIALLHDKWKMICNALKPRSHDPRIKVKSTGVTNISEDKPEAVYRNLREHMKKWLESDEFCRKIESKLRTHIGNVSECFKIFLEIDKPEIWELPWDVWAFREDYANCEIIPTSSEYGKKNQHKTTADIAQPSQGRILCIAGNSKGIDIDKDQIIIQKSLGELCDLQFLQEPTPQELHDELFDDKGWQVFFFAGHSNSDNNATNGVLYINQNPDHNSIKVEDLKSGLKRAINKGLQLLIFNSCSSLGIATDIVAEGLDLPSIIVMRAPLPDVVAQDFVKSLFTYLAAGELLFLAVRKAKNDLQKWDSQFPGASGIPMLCQHPTFEEFVLPQPEADRPVVPTTDPVTANRPPSYPQFTISTKFMQRTSISLAGLAIGYPLIGQNLASAINTFGMENHRSNQFLIAKASYNLAVLINPTNGEPYYNLSELCKDLSDRKCERESMQSAVWLGIPEAHAQISKSFLRENKPEDALKAIALCFQNAKQDGVKSACFKNRGWVRLNQKRYDSAEPDLRQAISLSNKTPEAHCLLAQVLEAKGKPQEALTHWEETLKSANSRIPAQDECIQMAKERLPKTGKTK